MSKFKPVSSKVNLPELEEKINEFWKENTTFKKSIDQRDQDNPFIFVDGPPFVTGSPHYGSLLPSIAKDMIPRYETMMGKKVRRVFGWDCHGLPIEEKVNKLFGIKSNAQLETKFGIERYVQECRKYVQTVTSDWRWYVDKIGRWVDMDNAYYTMNVDFMESVIWGFKQIYEKGLIYKGKRVSLYSTDTSTPVSQFEVAMDTDNYRDTEDLSVFVKFEIENSAPLGNYDKPVYFLAWTTTPWTIPANFALSINPKFTYVLVEYDNEYFIVSKNRVAYSFGDNEIKIIKEFSGKDFEGITYKPIYDFYTKDKTENDFKVYLSLDVTDEEGTGVLHSAPAFGEVDFLLGQKYGLSATSNIDSEGKLVIEPWKGIYLRDASPLIAEDLQKKGNLLRSQVYIHRLPFYRGSNPLIYMAQDAYFIDIQKIKKRMLELNEDITWIPSHIKEGRFKNTIETSPDWCISRNRYWATIMPIWKSEDGDEIVVGSIEEMMEFTDQITKKEENGKVSYYFENESMDLHRDICDKIILNKNGKKYSRIPEVLDCWMDSGSVPFAEYHYPFENKEAFEKGRPADFIVEYTPQVRAWFSMLLRISTMIFDDTAFVTAISHGTIAGSDGRKMSKSFGNYPDPKLVLEKYGGDALRVYLMGSTVMLGEDMNFSEESLAEGYRFLLIYWNTYKFFVDYATVAKWDCDIKIGDLNILDKWILAKLTQIVLDLNKAFTKYNTVKVTSLIRDFIINDFSTWYIRRSRDRVGSEALENDRNTCLSVMYGVLVTLTKLAAPLIPFITEEMFKNLTGEESVHLQNYPQGDKNLLNDKLVLDMETVRKIAEKGHSLRKEAAIKLRQPLKSVKYSNTEKLSKDLEEILADELNVKSVEYQKSSDEELKVELDTNITPELQEEGEARDLIRQIQQLRKDANLTLADKTKIIAPTWPKNYEKQILAGSSSVSIGIGLELKITKVE